MLRIPVDEDHRLRRYSEFTDLFRAGQFKTARQGA
jgi:hypothetical protein